MPDAADKGEKPEGEKGETDAAPAGAPEAAVPATPATEEEADKKEDGGDDTAAEDSKTRPAPTTVDSAAAPEAPKKKKSRFAPPPVGADSLLSAAAAAAATAGLPGVSAVTLPGAAGAAGAAAGAAAGGGVTLPGMAGVMAGVTLPGVGMGGAGGMGGMPNPQLKTLIELFVGNIPVGCTQMGIHEFINAAMVQMKLNTLPGNPCTSIRLSAKFAFAVFRTPEEATAAVKLSGIPYLGNFLKFQRPSNYTGPPDPPCTWQQLTGQEAPPAVALALGGGGGGGTGGGGGMGGVNPADKLERELFLGNLPPDVQPQVLKEYIAGAAIQVGLVKGDENPIIAIRMNPGARFAFLEFRTQEACTAVLNMDGLPFSGSALSLARPSKYVGPNKAHKTWFDVLAEGNFMAEGGAPANSKVVRIGNVVTEEELTDPQVFTEVMEDMREECGKHGAVTSLHIPRPGSSQGGVGFVFVQFEALDFAGRAKAAFETRTFDGKPVTAVYYPEDKYLAQDYSA